MTSRFTIKLVNEYNEDYIVLLQRASRGDYQRLLSSFRLLKDVYDVIQLLFDKDGALSSPCSFWFRGNQSRLRRLGFDGEQIKNIFGFLDYVQMTQGKTFEECLGCSS
jgi:hypothetical protein